MPPPGVPIFFFLPFSLFFIFFFSFFFDCAKAKIVERAFTFVVYFAERSEIARGHLESSRSHRECVRCVHWPRAFFLFFFFSS